MKLQVSHTAPVVDDMSVGEEFAFARLYRAKRLGRPVPRAAAVLLAEPPAPKPPKGKRDGRTLPWLAAQLGITLAQLRYRIYILGQKRRDLEAQVLS